MKKLILFLMIALPLTGFSKGNKDIVGNWREVKRMTVDNKKVDYQDTILPSSSPALCLTTKPHPN